VGTGEVAVEVVVNCVGDALCAVYGLDGQELRSARCAHDSTARSSLDPFSCTSRRLSVEKGPACCHLPASSRVAPQKDGRGEARKWTQLVAEISRVVADSRGLLAIMIGHRT